MNLRADLETEKFKTTIKKMEEDRSDLVSAIVKLKSSINELKEVVKDFWMHFQKLIKNLMKFM